jgi:hypothetical protein
MGSHQDDDLDEPFHNNDYYADDHFPSGQPSSAGHFSFAGNTSGHEFQAPNNVYKFDAGGSQYRLGSQTFPSTGPLIANGLQDYHAQVAQPSYGSAQGFPQIDYPFGFNLNAGPLQGSSTSRISAVPEHGSNYRCHVALEPDFCKGAGSRTNSSQHLWDANSIVTNTVSVS